MIVDNIIICGTSSVGGTESNTLKAEKQNDASIIASIIIIGSITFTPKYKLKIKGTIESIKPKINEARIFPKTIDHNEIGADNSLSKVLNRASHGMTAEPIEVAEK